MFSGFQDGTMAQLRMRTILHAISSTPITKSFSPAVMKS
jgi:hypothetical protein